jgi:hypothetical protein
MYPVLDARDRVAGRLQAPEATEAYREAASKVERIDSGQRGD